MSFAGGSGGRQSDANNGFGVQSSQNNNPFGQQPSSAASPTCFYLGLPYPCAGSTSSAAASSSACEFLGVPCPTLSSSSAVAIVQPSTTPTSSASPTPLIPQGTGLLTTMTTTNAFGFPNSMVGRLFAVETVIQGQTTTMQEVLGATATWVVTPSSSSSSTPSPSSSNIPSSTPSVASSLIPAAASSADASSTTPLEVSPSTPVPASSSPVTSIAANGAANASAPTAQQSTHHGISGGAIAAAVIVPIVVVALLGLLLLLFLRRRRRNRSMATDSSSAGPSTTAAYVATDKPGFVSTSVPYGSTAKDQYGTENSTGASTLASSPTHGSASALEKTLEAGDNLPSSYYSHNAAATPALGTAAMATNGQRSVSGNTYPTTQSNDFAVDPHHFSNFSGNGSAADLGRGNNQPGGYNPAVLNSEQSRGAAGQQYLTAEPREDEMSVVSDEDGETEVEYHDAQVSNAAVGVTQRASVINMIDTKHGRVGSASSTKSGASSGRASS